MITRQVGIPSRGRESSSTYRQSGQGLLGRYTMDWAAGLERKILPIALLVGALITLLIGLQSALSYYVAAASEPVSFTTAAFWCGGSIVLTVLLAGLGIREYKSRQWQGSRQKPAEQSRYDSVTGLPTRRVFRAWLDEALGPTGLDGRVIAVLLLDLEQIKMVNDLKGSVGGDAALRVLAARIKGCLRGSDAVARMTGDEFAVLLRDPGTVEEVGAAAQKILQAVVLPMTLQGEEILINSRIGIALYPTDGSSPQDMMERATQALTSAKDQGLPILFSSHELNAQVFESAERESLPG